jgi:hypothetical protein
MQRDAGVAVLDRAELIKWADVLEALAKAWSDEDVELGLTGALAMGRGGKGPGRICRFYRFRMKRGAASVELEEQIKWWDALDWLVGRLGLDVARGLQMARECTHPEARWLVSLFPGVGVAVTRERMVEVMREQGENPLALVLLRELSGQGARLDVLADTGYALAQAQASSRSGGANAFRWAQEATAQGERHGIYQLAYHYHFGWSCEKDTERAARLFLQAAQLGDCAAQWTYGEYACGQFDWLRYHWWLAAASRGFRLFGDLAAEVDSVLPLFEKGEKGRVLHLFTALLKIGLDAVSNQVFDNSVSLNTVQTMQRVFALHDAMLIRARQALVCWSIVGRRLGVAKDMRMMIAKAAWEEVWQWGEKGETTGMGIPRLRGMRGMRGMRGIPLLLEPGAVGKGAETGRERSGKRQGNVTTTHRQNAESGVGALPNEPR